MKSKHPIEVIDITHQVNHIFPKQIQLFDDYRDDPSNANARIISVLFRHRQIEMISDGNKIKEIKVIYNDNT